MNNIQLDRLINKTNTKIKYYYEHYSSSINLWVTKSVIDPHYVICVELVHDFGGAITSFEILSRGTNELDPEEFLKVINQLHQSWPYMPILFHDFPKKVINSLRDKFGSFIIRDDVVINKNY